MPHPKPLVCVGTVAIDGLETPFGKRPKILGGSATFFSYVASFFTPVSLVAVVGEDFPQAYRQVLKERPIDLSHLETLKGKTFSWQGEYRDDMNSAHTLRTDLNTLLEFNPVLRFSRTPEFLFLANIDPDLQLKVLDQVNSKKVKFAAADTMNFWIESKRSSLLKVMKRIDAIVLNDGEAKMLSGERQTLKAALQVLKLGPKWVIVKKGEHGVVLVSKTKIFSLPAYPVTQVKDPTGAGDTFAGGFMGYLAWTRNLSFDNMKRALAVGTVTASTTVQDFGLDAVRKTSKSLLLKRLAEFKKLSSF